MAKPEATAVANTESPLPDTAEAAAAPDTTRLKRKVAKHSTATARHSSRLRASMDMGAFLSTTSALFSRRADNLVRMVTICASTSRDNDSVVISRFRCSPDAQITVRINVQTVSVLSKHVLHVPGYDSVTRCCTLCTFSSTSQSRSRYHLIGVSCSPTEDRNLASSE